MQPKYPYKASVAFFALLRKEVVRFLRIWSQTLLPPLITQSLYFIIFGTFIGSQVSDINGVSYMAFIVPGLVMMAVINSAYQNVVSSFFGAKFQKNLEELIVSPTKHMAVISAYVLAGMLRGLLVGVFVFLVSVAFVRPEVEHFGIVLLFIVLTSAIFSLGGLINGIFARKFDDLSIFVTFILTPLTYFAGVFYSIQMLPPLWQTLSKFNPILYMVDGFRYGFHGFSDIPLWVNFSVLIGFLVLGLGWTLWLFKKGVGLKN